jgi:hypothetical protein
MTARDDLYFYGIAAVPINQPQPTAQDAALFESLVKTPEGRQVLDVLQQASPQMGTWKIFKKIGGAIKQIGKITQPFTSALARQFVPKGILDSLAKADPTTHSKLANIINQVSPVAQQAFKALTTPKTAPAAAPAATFFSKENTTRNLLTAGGAALVIVGGGFLIFKKPAAQPIPATMGGCK